MALHDAGLVVVVRFKERWADTNTNYGVNTTVLSYSLPDSAEKIPGEMIAAVQFPSEDALYRPIREEADDMGVLSVEMQPIMWWSSRSGHSCGETSFCYWGWKNHG